MRNGGDFNREIRQIRERGKGKREGLNPPSPSASTRRQGYPLTPYFTREPVRTCILPVDFACFTRAASRDEAVRSFAEAGSALSLSMAGCWIAEEATSP